MNGNEKCIKIVRLQYVAQYVKGAVSQSSNPVLIIASNAFEKISGHSFLSFLYVFICERKRLTILLQQSGGLYSTHIDSSSLGVPMIFGNPYPHR